MLSGWILAEKLAAEGEICWGAMPQFEAM